MHLLHCSHLYQQPLDSKAIKLSAFIIWDQFLVNQMMDTIFKNPIDHIPLTKNIIGVYK